MERSARRPGRLFPQRGHDHARCVEGALAEASALCVGAGRRLTPLRRRVLELVWSSHQPIGAYAMLSRLKTGGRAGAPATVYRALDFLRRAGLIHRLASLNAFVGCAHPGASHLVEFLICRRCGTSAELEDKRVAEAIGRSAAQNGFDIESRVIELSGLCARCGAGAKLARPPAR
ncbi:MAG: Fur family transcriptional regulator [Pseudomonadota bacterium]